MHPDRNQAIHNFFNPEPMAQAHFKTNMVSGIASAWKEDEQGTRAHVLRHQADHMYHWHVTEHGRDGEPTKEGREATAEKAFQAATRAMNCTTYKLS